MKNLLLILSLSLILFFLVGCSSKKEINSDVDNRQTIPDCQELPDFQGKSFGDLYEYTIKNFELYNVCSNRVKLLKSL